MNHKQFDCPVNVLYNLRYKINGIVFNSLTFKKPNILLLKHFKISIFKLYNKSQKKRNLFEINSLIHKKNNKCQNKNQNKRKTKQQNQTTNRAANFKSKTYNRRDYIIEQTVLQL